VSPRRAQFFYLFRMRSVNRHSAGVVPHVRPAPDERAWSPTMAVSVLRVPQATDDAHPPYNPNYRRFSVNLGEPWKIRPDIERTLRYEI